MENLETLYFCERERKIVKVVNSKHQADEWIQQGSLHEITKVDYAGNERKKIAYIDGMDFQEFLGAFVVKDHYRFEKIIEQLYRYR